MELLLNILFIVLSLLAAAAVAGYCSDRGRRDSAGDLYPGGILDDRLRHIDDPGWHILPLGRWKHEKALV